MNLKESIKNQVHNKVVNEVDWEDTFSDVKKTCIPQDVLLQDLNTALVRALKPSPKRGKMSMDKPVVHRLDIQKAQDEDGEINIQSFIDNITDFPTKLITQNGKMETTSKGEMWVVNTGIPALKGIVYDEKGKEFYSINTCPGAGACALVCYARKGRYIMFDHTSMGLTRRLNLMLNHPETFEQIIYLELKRICVQKNRKGVKVMMRWNDAGDFFSKGYWNIAERVTARLLREKHDFLSYAYTKMGDYIGDISSNILTNFSREANKREMGKVDMDKTKASTIVGKDLFRDLFVLTNRGKIDKGDDGKPMFKDESGRDELKKRLADKYNVSLSSVVYQEELPDEEQEKNSFNAIVLPSGDSDESAQRLDVMLIFLLIH